MAIYPTAHANFPFQVPSSEEINKRGRGGGRRGGSLFIKSGSYVRQNIRSTKILLSDREICSISGLKNFCAKTNKRGVLIRVGGGRLEIFSEIY